MGEVSPLPTIWSQKVFWENTPLLSAGRRCGTDNTHTHTLQLKKEKKKKKKKEIWYFPESSTLVKCF